MGLGKLLTRSVPGAGTRYDVYNDTTNALIDSFHVVGDLAPDWPTSAYKSGMSIPGAWRASLLLSGLLAGSPWNAFRRPTGDDPAPRIVTPTPPLLEQPAPPETRFTTFRSLALDYIWEGNGVGIIAARDRAGWPTAIVPVPASMVFVRRVSERNYPIPMGEVEYLIGTMSFTPDQVVHIKGPCAPGELRGIGVLEAHLTTLSGAQQLSADAHQVKGVPTGVLKSQNPDLGPKEAADLKTAWLTAQRNRTVAVLNASTEFEALAWNPEEAQLIEARRFSLTEIELIFGLPVGWLGGQSDSKTYRTVESDAINLQKFTLNEIISPFKETLSQCFPRGMFVEPDLDAILRGDTLGRYQSYDLATGKKPWLLPSEVRARERLPAVPGIDDAPAPAAPTQPNPDPNKPTNDDPEIEEKP